MRIYAVADIHGRVDKIELIRNNISRLKPDALIVAGDITQFRKPDYIIAQLETLSVPILAVRGNTDLLVVESLLEKYRSMFPLHLRETIIDNISFVGLSGTVLLPFRSKVCFREKRMVNKVEHLVKKDTVFVAHPPPLGAQDKVLGRFHAGSGGMRELISKKQPALFICGHIHEDPGLTYVGKTLVVNCNIGRNGQGVIIDLTEDGEPQAAFLPDKNMPT